MPRFVIALAVVAATFGATSAAPPTQREQKVRSDREKVESEGFWIYNDLPKAFAEAKASGRPVLVVLRCVPCEECVKLDDDVLDRDSTLRPLLEKYVRVRVVSTNGLDLSLFQYDTDQSWAAFLLTADKQILGRFGTRSHRTNWVGDVSTEGMAEALRRGLDLHARPAADRAALAGKRGPAPEFPTPEQFPSLKTRYTSTLNYAGNVVQSCIHCHQIGDARREFYRKKREAIPEEVLFPFPHPKALGLTLDPKTAATVTAVASGSLAATAGFAAGDKIETLNGQPVISMADVQWVLHNAPASGGAVSAGVQRAGASGLKTVTLTLPAGWRRADAISWRASTWGRRRRALGGRKLVPQEGGGGLLIEHVGQYGPHAAAKAAGLQKGDVLVSFDGRTDFAREADVIAHGVTARKPGEKVPVVVTRGGKRLTLSLPMQE